MMENCRMLYTVHDALDYATKRSSLDDEVKNALIYEVLHKPHDTLTSDEWEYAKQQMDNPNYDPLKRIMTEGLYYHPRTAKCDRCRQFVPECAYDKRMGMRHLLCNRCVDAVVVWQKSTGQVCDALLEFKSERRVDTPL